MSEVMDPADRFTALNADLVEIANSVRGNGLVCSISLKDVDTGLVTGTAAIILPQDLRTLGKTPPGLGEWSCFSVIRPDGIDLYQAQISPVEAARIILEIGRRQNSVAEVLNYFRDSAGGEKVDFEDSSTDSGRAALNEKAHLTLGLLRNRAKTEQGSVAGKAAALIIASEDDHFATLCAFAQKTRAFLSEQRDNFDIF